MLKAIYQVEVNNVPDNHYDFKFMVARYCHGELWYYGVYDEYDRAIAARDEIDGIILER